MPKKKPSDKCVKCNSQVYPGANGGAIWLCGGEFFLFCKGCDAILKTRGTSDLIRRFLDDKLDISDIDRDMINARKARNRGEKLWKRPD